MNLESEVNMQIAITNGANHFTPDKALLSEIVYRSMKCFSLSEQQATVLVTSIIDAQLTYSDDFADLEDVLRGTLDFFEIYKSNLQGAQFETAPF